MAQLPFMQQLEAHDNELEVREHIANGTYNTQSLAIAQEWLRRKEEARSATSSAKRDAREEEILSIAKEANRIASEARTAAFEQARWAKWAAIIATIAAIIATVAAMAGK